MTKTVIKALCAVQADLSAHGISKSDRNKFDDYLYRGIDAVLNAMAPILSKHGVIIMPSVTSCEIRQILTSKDKTMNHAKVEVEYTLYDADGDSITHKFVGEGMDRGDKSVNKACTAAFKYFLFEAFCIPIQSTPDADKASPKIGSQVEVFESAAMVSAGMQMNECFDVDDYHGAAQLYDEWTNERESQVIICRAPSKGGQLTTVNRAKLKSTPFRLALNEVRGITTGET
jgi:hypothetical protein